jgi:hypothetical protein
MNFEFLVEGKESESVMSFSFSLEDEGVIGVELKSRIGIVSVGSG